MAAAGGGCTHPPTHLRLDENVAAHWHLGEIVDIDI
jgi:hypothetical protein